MRLGGVEPSIALIRIDDKCPLAIASTVVSGLIGLTGAFFGLEAMIVPLFHGKVIAKELLRAEASIYVFLRERGEHLRTIADVKSMVPSFTDTSLDALTDSGSCALVLHRVVFRAPVIPSLDLRKRYLMLDKGASAAGIIIEEMIRLFSSIKQIVILESGNPKMHSGCCPCFKGRPDTCASDTCKSRSLFLNGRV
jgi:hypothetical protein